MSMESLLVGLLSSTDRPEVRLRWNTRTQQFSCRIYARNRDKTGHGVGPTVAEAIEAATIDRMGGAK
jgi:hypothetical protein